MDPDAQIQVATLGTALFYKKGNNISFYGDEATNVYTGDIYAKLKTDGFTRVYGLASTPDFGGQPNTIDTTTLDNIKSETSVLGLQPTVEVSYEINMMDFNHIKGSSDSHTFSPKHNLKAMKDLELAGDNGVAHWVLVKKSGVIVEYDATTSISYTADAQQDIEKFSIYHDVKDEIRVSLPPISASL